MNRKEKAMNNFLEGYTCAQSLVLAFADLLDVDEKQLMKLCSSFGGGISRLREVCGAESGTAMVLGLFYGFDGPDTGEVKNAHYARVQECALAFEEVYGTIVCRELLGLTVKHDIPVAEARTGEYYKKRPCKEFIGCAAEILEKYIEAHPVSKQEEGSL